MDSVWQQVKADKKYPTLKGEVKTQVLVIGLEGNRRLGNDILVGVFYIMSENEDGDLRSLTERKIKHYTNVFWEPETFDRVDIENSLYAFFQ